MLMTISSTVKPFLTSLEPEFGRACGFLKNFPLQRLHFILHEAAQDSDLHMSAWLFCSASECVRPCSDFVFLEFGGKGGGGWGLLV